MPAKKTTKQNSAIDVSDLEVALKKLPPRDIIELLEKSGIQMQRTQSFRGPLPPQVLDKIDSNTANKLATGYIEHVKNQDQLNDKVVESSGRNKANERFHATIRTITVLLIGFAVFSVCVFTNNIALLKDLIPLLAMLGGGTGIGIYMYLNKSKQFKKPDLRIED